MFSTTTTKRHFTDEQLAAIKSRPIPAHVAIIPDGNRRWALRRAASAIIGHEQGADTLTIAVEAAKELGIKALTVYTFSTENWQRPEEEINALMWLFERYVRKQEKIMIREGTRLMTIGDLTKVPPSVRKAFEDVKSSTAHCNDIDLILAINYGGRDEMCRAFNTILAKVKKGQIEGEIDEATVARHLDTAEWGDPQLLIRTSGEVRISNFLIWQLAYTEIYLANVLWPEFSPQHLYDAVSTFQQRERRLGN